MERIFTALKTACETHYRERLVSLALFGSAGRGTMRPDSGIDILLVVEGLPSGRIKRVEEFDAVELAVESKAIEVGRSEPLLLSPVFKTPAEARTGAPLFLDMTEDARILVDRDGFLHALLGDLRNRLKKLGAKRVWRGSAWYWDLKPDFKCGEVFEI